MPKLTDIEEIGRLIAPGDLLAFGYVHHGHEPLFAALGEFDWHGDVDVFIPPVLKYRAEDLFPLNRVSARFGGRIPVTQIVPGFAETLKRGNVDLLPLPFSRIPGYLKEQARRRRVWVFCDLHPPDARGLCNTGYAAPFPWSLFEDGVAVGSLTRYDVDFVVTEYGIAEVTRRSRRERVRGLIGVAHPEHRERLTAAARQMGLL